MELELDLGSDNCSDATSNSDERELELDLGSGNCSDATSEDTEPVVAFRSPTGLELDLGDNPPATGLGMDSVLSLGPSTDLDLADGPPAADSELELVIDFVASPPAKRRRTRAHTEPRAGLVTSVVAATPAAKVSSRGSFRRGRGSGSEYRKHAAFRRDNGLVDAQGHWTYSQALRALENTLPPMSARAHDVLHIIWQLFERHGLCASHVDQAWMLCQSIYRGATQPSYPANFFRGKAPQIPGLHLVPHGRHVHRTIAPCMLPRSKMWLNIERRFARGAESLQLQGVHVATWRPSLQDEGNGLLQRIAGNMYSIPVVGWYLLLALVTVLPRRSGQHHAPSLVAQKAASVAATPVGLHPRSIAQVLLHTLLEKWPEAFGGWCTTAIVSMASLCSGADFVKDFAKHLVAEIVCLPGVPELQVINKFACEVDKRVWAIRQRGQGSPERFYPDVHSLPLGEMSSADICLISAMCTSVSFCNRDRRSLHCCDASDPKHASGATTNSALKYVEQKKPKVVIMENVLAVAKSSRVATTAAGQASPDIELVLSRLRAAGYVCGYDAQDTVNWLMPQTRSRIYVWAHLQNLPGPAALSLDSIRLAVPSGHIPLSACLLP